MPNGTPETTPESGGPNRGLLIGLAVLALVAVAVGFYFIGRAAADASGAEKEGEERGRAAETASYAEGRPKYRAIYQQGFTAGRAQGRRQGERAGERSGAERGEKAGLERGEKVGELRGEREGIEEGSKATLGGLTDWQVGSWYIVKFVTGTGGVAYSVDARKQMADDERYAICADNPGDICTEPIRGS